MTVSSAVSTNEQRPRPQAILCVMYTQGDATPNAHLTYSARPRMFHAPWQRWTWGAVPLVSMSVLAFLPFTAAWRRVRKMLTHLTTALPRASPGARLLALQCARRAVSGGRLRVPRGLLLSRCTELWQELTQAHWLHLPDLEAAPVQVQPCDATLLHPAPGRRARCHAAHWALRPAPLAAPAAATPAEQLTALVLAAHTAPAGPAPGLSTISRRYGRSPQQTADLLDRLVLTRTLSAWRHQQDTGEVHRQPGALRGGSCVISPRPAG